MAAAHTSELLRVVGLCSRACDGLALWVETLALSERAAPHGRRVARPLSGAASGDWRVTGWSVAQAAHWKAFGRREKTAVR